MTEPASAFAAIPLTAANHARVLLHAAVFHLVAAIHALDDGGDLSLPRVLERHPFLRGYLAAMAPELPDGLAWPDAPSWWRRELGRWEAGASGSLPLLALAPLGLGPAHRVAVVAAALVDEDPRFGSVVAELQRPGEARRPSFATLAAVAADPDLDAWSLRSTLLRAAIVEADAPVSAADPPASAADLPDLDAPVRVPAEVWGALRAGHDGLELAWLDHRSFHQLTPLREALVSDGLRGRVARAEQLLRVSGGAVAIIGSPASGRRRLAGSIARALGHGALFVDAEGLADHRRRRIGPLATVLGAIPVLRVTTQPGQVVEVAPLVGYAGPIIVVADTAGGLAGPALEGAVRLQLPRLGPDERRRHWGAAFGTTPVDGLDRIAERFVLPAGHLRRLATQATVGARLAGRANVTFDDVAAARRALNRRRLDGLAHRLDPLPGWHRLVVDDATRAQLTALQARCMRRERLPQHLGDAFGSGSEVGSGGEVGVRALFGGASGTGKTLAARILAAELGTEVFRVDLAAIVDRYVGETEKNLHRVLAGAEELDVVLLIDEGDSLLGARTEVSNANDRFANLETNYLLQRLEQHQGIVLVTTNAADRIDPAFHRRLDAVLHFREPGSAERRAIWTLHLPDDHQVPACHLDELAARAELTGGQIRNATMHAVLLALDEGSPVGALHLDAAVALEYGKAGAVSPFQPAGEVRRLRRADAFLDALP